MELRIGTRGSQLALRQSEIIAAELERVNPAIKTKIQIIKTLGDQKQGTENPSLLCVISYVKQMVIGKDMQKCTTLAFVQSKLCPQHAITLTLKLLQFTLIY